MGGNFKVEAVSVQPTGDVLWKLHFHVTCYCSMDFAKLPYDTQTCKLPYGLTFDTDENVRLLWSHYGPTPEDERDFLPGVKGLTSLDLKVSNAATSHHVSPDNRSHLSVTFTFQRDVRQWMHAYYVQALLMVCVAWIGFFVPPGAVPARVAL